MPNFTIIRLHIEGTCNLCGCNDDVLNLLAEYDNLPDTPDLETIERNYQNQISVEVSWIHAN